MGPAGRALPALVALGCGPGGRAPCDGRCDTGTPATPGWPVVVEASGPVSCPDPAARDIAYYDSTATLEDRDAPVWFPGSGLVVADLTGDGNDDLLLPGIWDTLFYRGSATGELVYDSAPFADLELWWASGGSAADYDGDGDLDVLVTRFAAPDKLLRNDGGVFVDVSEAAGIAPLLHRSMASSWADFDRDGDLDLFVGCYGFIDQTLGDHSNFPPADPSHLFVNQGDGTFTDRADLLPREVHDGYTLAGGWHDLDDDGWPELYVVNDFGQSYPNALLWNREGVLVSDLGASGLGLAITAMGLAIGDLNDDDVPDMFMPAFNDLALMLSNPPTGLWYEWAAEKGVRYEPAVGQKIGWGGDLVDLDNDGDLDLPVAFGWLDSVYVAPIRELDAVYVQLEDGRFEDRAMAFGLADPGIGRGFVAVDLDRDGWVDLVKRQINGPALVHRSRCGVEAWLGVELRQDGLNRFAVGAKIRVFAGGSSQTRVILAGGHNLASGGPPRVHFGLGGHERVGRVEITWPDGEVSNLLDLAPRQHLTVRRGL